MTYQLHRDPRSSHQRIARYVKTLGRDPILDVGASNGQIGQLLDGNGLTIDAIEPNQASADNAAPFYRTIHCASVEEVELPRDHYRVLICADILEHTIDPVRAIGRLLEAATDDVRLVISLPNVGHLAARAIVLAGKFPQDDRGIFDRTHLHFYTRDTMMALMADAGLQVLHLGATPVPLEEVWPPQLPTSLRDIGMNLQTAAIRMAPTLFAYQWLVVATRNRAR
jgi:2-polyprenyl-3-methyl-5-hydroxy-6-metoxy-1,4-benzoquinol methylase